MSSGKRKITRKRRRGGRRRGRGGRTIQDNRSPVVPVNNRFAATVLSPDRIMVKLKFAYVLNVSGVSAQVYTFVGNSVYDPDPLVGGTSAEGFNEWLAFYDYHRVHRSAINVEVTPDYSGSAPNQSNVRIFVIPSTAATWSLSTNSTASARFVKQAFLAWTGRGVAKIRSTMQTAKIFGLHTNTADNFNLAGIGLSNPTTKWYWHIIFSPMNQSVTDVKVFSQIVINYTVEFFNRKAAIALSIPTVTFQDGEVISYINEPPEKEQREEVCPTLPFSNK